MMKMNYDKEIEEGINYKFKQLGIVDEDGSKFKLIEGFVRSKQSFDPTKSDNPLAYFKTIAHSYILTKLIKPTWK